MITRPLFHSLPSPTHQFLPPPGCHSPWTQPKSRAGSCLEGGRRERGNYLHVFAQRAGVRVRLVAHLAKIGLVARVHMHVLLAVAAIGKASVAAFELAFEGLLP